MKLDVFKVGLGLVDILPSLMKMVQDIAIESLDYFNNKHVLTRLEACESFMHSIHCGTVRWLTLRAIQLGFKYSLNSNN